MLYFATGIFGLTDKTASAPNPQERIFLQGVLVVTFIQIIISVLAIWGAVGYRSWPVMLSLAWVSIQMALGVVGCIVMAVMTSQFRGLIIMLGSFLIQFSFFWMPMKGYLHDHEQLKTEANNYEITELGERQGPGGFSDTKTEAENSVEMV